MVRFKKQILKALTPALSLAMPLLAEAQYDPGAVNPDLPERSLKEILGTITGYASFLLGAIGVIMFIVGGIMYVTAAGNPDKVSTATKLITYAIVGILIGLLGYSITLILQSAAEGDDPY